MHMVAHAVQLLYRHMTVLLRFPISAVTRTVDSQSEFCYSYDYSKYGIVMLVMYICGMVCSSVTCEIHPTISNHAN